MINVLGVVVKHVEARHADGAIELHTEELINGMYNLIITDKHSNKKGGAKIIVQHE